ncbi:MAG: hypothetical protein H3C57_00620 [Gammaproteobacteria bacterium]|nr:hypothetical protein [Gammaproteobacteria bacterium]
MTPGERRSARAEAIREAARDAGVTVDALRKRMRRCGEAPEEAASRMQRRDPLLRARICAAAKQAGVAERAIYKRITGRGETPEEAAASIAARKARQEANKGHRPSGADRDKTIASEQSAISAALRRWR